VRGTHREWDALVVPTAPISPNPNDLPPGWEGKLVTYGAMMGEIALGLFLAGDAIDLSRELIVKRFTDEQTDWLVVALAGVGLAMDFVPATALGNAATAAVKAVVKFLPPGAAQALLRMGGTLPEACRILADLLSRIPAPPGSSQLSIAANAAATFVNQINRCLASPLQLAINHVTDVLVILQRRAAQHFKDEAVEGFAYAVKEGRQNVIEGMFDAGTGYTEAVIEQSLDVLRETNRLGPLSGFSDDAIRGIGAATEAVGPDSPLVREFLRGPMINSARANLALGNVKELRGVEGLNNMVTFLRNNGNNANIDGCIYESTVARRIINGEVPSAGALQRVSHDGIVGYNRVDSMTETLAMQIKHKTDPDSVFTPSDICGSGGVCGDAYLAELKAQAADLSRQAALVTNRPVNSTLATLLLSHEIQHVLVLD